MIDIHAKPNIREKKHKKHPWWQVVQVLSRLNTELVVVGVKLKTDISIITIIEIRTF